MSDQRRFAVIILAAGQGTRMRSDTHKVLHPIAGRPLLLHLLDRVDALGADRRVVVVGKGRDQVEAASPAAMSSSHSRPAEGHGPRRSAGRQARWTATTARFLSSTATRRSSRRRPSAG